MGLAMGWATGQQTEARRRARHTGKAAAASPPVTPEPPPAGATAFLSTARRPPACAPPPPLPPVLLASGDCHCLPTLRRWGMPGGRVGVHVVGSDLPLAPAAPPTLLLRRLAAGLGELLREPPAEPVPPSERACGLGELEVEEVGEGDVEEEIEVEIAAELEQIVRRPSCGELASERA